MKYKGYVGSIYWSDEDNCYEGKILHVKVNYHIYQGMTLRELRKYFKLVVKLHIKIENEEPK